MKPISSLFDQRLLLERRDHFRQGEADAGMAAAKFPNEAGEIRTGAAVEEADPKGADLASKGTTGHVRRRGRGVQCLAGFDEEDLTVGGEPDPVAAAEEEWDSDFVFEVGDLFADGGLRNVQSPGRAAEALVLRERAKIPEVSQLHTPFYRFLR